MKPVFQTTFGDKVGNCFAACIASIFEVSIDAVPNFCCAPEGEWPKNLNDWLAARGLFSVEVMVSKDSGAPLYAMPDGVPCIITGASPRNGVNHCVIGKYNAPDGTFVIVHDPHPDGTGLVGVPVSIEFFAALYPHLVAQGLPAANP